MERVIHPQDFGFTRIRQHYFLLGLIFLCFFSSIVPAQQVIFLKNPSLEDNPGYSRTPGGWKNCAFNEASPPDVHPVEGGSFRVRQKPQDGETYLGLVVRENVTCESVGQMLSSPLQKGGCYGLSAWLCRSDTLISLAPESRNVVINYNQPVVLKIWGGLSPCGRKVLLAASPPVTDTDWKKYKFQFQAPDSLSYLTFEAFYAAGTDTAYNGNLLLDGFSPLIPLNCDDLRPLVNEETVRQPPYTFIKTKPITETHRETHIRGSVYYREMTNLRIIERPEEMESFLNSLCNRAGFRIGGGSLTDFQKIAWLEIGANLRKHEGFFLRVALPYVDEKLNKKRLKSIRKTLREAGLQDHRYQIEWVEQAPDPSGGWFCGDGDVWLKLEEK